MGSCCIVKSCNSKKSAKLTGAKVSFHRLEHILKRLVCPIGYIFGHDIREITSFSRICSAHLPMLEAYYNRTGATIPSLTSRYVGNSKEDSDSDNDNATNHFGYHLPRLQLTEVRNEHLAENLNNNNVSEFEDLYNFHYLIQLAMAIKQCDNEGVNRRTMIADATRENCANEMDMASTSDSKISDGLKEDEDLRHPELNPEPAPTNGEIKHEERSQKEDEDGHVTSEDEDKLIINENCEKKDASKNEANATARPESVPSGSQVESREQSPKSSLKRPVDETEGLENSSKKPKIVDPQDQNALSVAQIDDSLSTIKCELQDLDLHIAQKEEEWNVLIRLQKKKEEKYVKLLRKRQVLIMKKDEESAEEDEDSTSFLHQQFRNFGNSHLPLMMMKHMLTENYMAQIPPTSRSPHSKDIPSTNGPLPPHNTVSVIDIHTNNSKAGGVGEAPQVSISPEVHSKLGRSLNAYMKPILPKPMNCVSGLTSSGGTPPPLTFPPTGYGPQGPTVSVHHLIAAHRKDNPNIPPIRGAKRGAWRHRYEGDKRGSPREPDRPSSVSSSNSETDIRLSQALSLTPKASLTNSMNNNSLLTMNDPSVSYKDVLLQFAQQLSQQDKHSSGSPQISIIPVSSGDTPSRKFEHTPDSTSVSRELSVPSQSTTQSPNLESSSALAKLLLESGGNSHGSISKSAAVDLSSYGSSPHSLTLSALLSGGTTTTTTHKDKPSSAAQMENRSKKSASEEGNSNPKCQGCHMQRAQFVCAGCSNQWYCSRNCQVTAWDKHSENCNG